MRTRSRPNVDCQGSKNHPAVSSAGAGPELREGIDSFPEAVLLIASIVLVAAGLWLAPPDETLCVAPNKSMHCSRESFDLVGH